MATVAGVYWPRLGTALLIAGQVWGPPPCGQPNVVFATPSDDAIGWTVPGVCTIYLNREIPWRRYPKWRCSAIVHEWGHLAGQKHSSDPRNVMYPVARSYWRCDVRNRRLAQEGKRLASGDR